MAPARLCVLRASAGSPQVLPRSRGLPQHGWRAGEWGPVGARRTGARRVPFDRLECGGYRFYLVRFARMKARALPTWLLFVARRSRRSRIRAAATQSSFQIHQLLGAS